MIKKIIFTVILLLISTSFTFSENINYLDLSKVLNTSVAGSKAQKELKKKIENTFSKYNKQVEDIKKKERELISKRKEISNEEYKKQITDLRDKIAKVTKDRQKEISGIANNRKKIKQELLKTLNPILANYMEKNNVKIVLDKSNILLGDKNLEITSIIMDELNKKLKSVKID